jgi:amino-acid N-acetyltransferase
MEHESPEAWEGKSILSSKPSTSKPKAKYQIRPAADADLKEIQAILQPYVAARKLLKRTLRELLTLMENGFVAEVAEGRSKKKKIVGFAAVEIYSRKLSEIQCLAVAEGFQGQGMGSELVRQCVERARERGVMEVMAISASDSFLMNLGFDYSLPDQKRALFYQLKSRDQIAKETLDE